MLGRGVICVGVQGVMGFWFVKEKYVFDLSVKLLLKSLGRHSCNVYCSVVLCTL